MPAQIETALFCADYWGKFRIKASKGHQIYVVTMDGSIGVPHCTCDGFKYSRDQSCKHIGFVWETGCFWNPQWCEGHSRIRKPFGYCINRNNIIESEPCPKCGGPTVPVKIAV